MIYTDNEKKIINYLKNKKRIGKNKTNILELYDELDIPVDIIEKVCDKLKKEGILIYDEDLKYTLNIEFNADDIPDYCESCGREFGDILIDEVYDKEIKTEEERQQRYKEKLDGDFEKRLFNTFDEEGRRWLNLYIQKESSDYTVAVLKSLKSKIKVENILHEKKRGKK